MSAEECSTAAAADQPTAREQVAALRSRGRRRLRLVVAGLAVLVLALMAVRVLLGAYTVTIPDFFRILGGEQIPGATYIVMQSKLPRAVGAALAGAAFGASGSLFRRTLRNPLASPDLIGISAGASAGAVVAMTVLGWRGPGMAIGALIGGLGVAGIVLAFARSGGARGSGGATTAMGSEKVIVAGIALSSLAMVIVSQIVLSLEKGDLQSVSVWTSGSLSTANWTRITWLAIALVILLPLGLAIHQALAPADLGADFAHGLGARPERTGYLALVVGALLASAATAAFGPLAFVALLSTPLARGLTGGRPSLPVAALVGAAIVVAADFLGTEAIPGVRLPTGILTGAAGAPLMLWLLIRSKSKV